MLDKRLFHFLKKDKSVIYKITGIQVINLMLSLFIQGTICYMLYELSIKKYSFTIWGICIVVIIAIMKIICYYLISIYQSRIGEIIRKNLRSNLFECILCNPRYSINYDAEALAKLETEGIEQLNLYYTVYIPQFFYSMIAPVILFVIFSYISLSVALIFLLAIPLIPVSIILVSRYAKKIFKTYWDKYLRLGGEFYDNLNGMTELKIFGVDDYIQEKMDDNSEEFRKITMKVLVMQLTSTAIMDFVAYGGAALGIGVSILNLVNGKISSPFVALFVIIAGIEFFIPMRALGSAFHISMNGVTAGNKILDIIEASDPSDGDIIIKNINDVRFENVAIGYNGFNVIDSFNLDISSPGLYSIIGKSGSGKSSIINTLLKEVNTEKGEILINGVNIINIKKDSLYKSICYVGYDSHIFNNSIYENFKLVNKNAKEEDMLEALKKVKLENFSLQHVIEENSTNISGGEKQRLCLAFYLTLDKDLYLFDEATSAIDKESEEIIFNTLKELSINKKVIVVSHRLNKMNETKLITFIDNEKIYVDSFNNLIKDNLNFQNLMKFEVKDELI